MSNFVMVPVPENRVQDVYSLLAKGPEPEQEVEEVKVNELSDHWSDEEIKRAYLESKSHIRNVLTLLAENPGQRFYSEQLYNELGLSRNQWSGVTGSFGKLVRNRYKKSTKPFVEAWDDEEGSMYYEMPAEHAAVIAAMI